MNIVINKQQYFDWLRNSINARAGGQFDWSVFSENDWERFWEGGYGVDDVMREEGSEIVPDHIHPEPIVPSHNWFFAGVVAGMVALLVIIAAIFSKPEDRP